MDWVCGIRGGTGEIYSYTGFWWEKLKERDHLEDLGLDQRNILKWILKSSVNKMAECGVD
jgi:hypothetical protein